MESVSVLGVRNRGEVNKKKKRKKSENEKKSGESDSCMEAYTHVNLEWRLENITDTRDGRCGDLCVPS